MKFLICLSKAFITGRSIQNAKVQSTHVEIVFQYELYPSKLLFFLCNSEFLLSSSGFFLSLGLFRVL
jgi:hypothetical protein